MSNKKDNGGPAFPVKTPTPGYNFETVHEGMTLRDYFAAKAMGNPENIDPVYYEQFARKCYLLADAMLKAREQ